MFPKRLREQREFCRLTQVDLADKLKISKQTVWKYEKGDVLPSVTTLLEIADILNCSIDYLLGRTDNRKLAIVEFEENGKQYKVGVPKDQADEIDLIKYQISQIQKTLTNLENK